MISRSRFFIRISLALLFILLLLLLVTVPSAAAEESVTSDVQVNTPVIEPEGENPPADVGSDDGDFAVSGDTSAEGASPSGETGLKAETVIGGDENGSEVTADSSGEEAMAPEVYAPEEAKEEKTVDSQTPEESASIEQEEAVPAPAPLSATAAGSYCVTVSDGINSMEFDGGTQVLLSDILNVLGYSVTDMDEISVERSSIDTSVVSVDETESGPALSDLGPFSSAGKNLIVYINGEPVELSLVDPMNISGTMSVEAFTDAMNYNGILTGDATVEDRDDKVCTLSEGVHDLYLNDNGLTLNTELRIPTGATLNIYGGKDETSDGTGSVTGAKGITICGGCLKVMSGNLNAEVEVEMNGQIFVYGGTINSSITCEAGSTTEIYDGVFTSSILACGGDVTVFGGSLTQQDIVYKAGDTGSVKFYSNKPVLAQLNALKSETKTNTIKLNSNGKVYTTLEEALKTARDSADIITLLADCALQGTNINISKSIDLRLNGYTLTGDIVIDSNAVLNLYGKGCSDPKGGNTGYVNGNIVVKTGGTFTISSTQVTGTLAVEEDTPDGTETKVEANYGVFSKGCDLRGGYYYNNPEAYGTPKKNYLSESYYAVTEERQDNYEYHVVPYAARIGTERYYTSLQDALDAVKDAEDTIVTILSTPATPTNGITIGADRTIELRLGGFTYNGNITVNGGTLAVTNGTIKGTSIINGGSLDCCDCTVEDVIVDKGTLKVSEATVTGAVTVNNDGICSIEKSAVTGKLTVHSPDAGVNADLSVFQGGCDLTAGHYSSNPETFLNSVSYAVYDDANNSEYPYQIGAAAVHDGSHGYGSVQNALDSLTGNTNEKATITCLSDLKEDMTIGADRNIELQLGGHAFGGTLTVNGGSLVVTNGTVTGKTSITGGSLDYRNCTVDDVVLNKGILKLDGATVTGDITVNNDGICSIDHSIVAGRLTVHSPDAGVSADLSVFQGGCDLTAGHYSSNPETFLNSVSYAVYDDADNSEYPYQIGAAVAHDGVHGYESVQKALDSLTGNTNEKAALTILADCSEDVMAGVNGNIELQLGGHAFGGTLTVSGGSLVVTNGTVTGKTSITGGSLDYRNCTVDDVVLNKGILKLDGATVTGDITVNNDGICFIDHSIVAGKLMVHSPYAGVSADLSVFQGGCDLTAGHYSSNPETFLSSVSTAVYDDADNSEYPYQIGAAAAHDGVRGYGSVQKALDSLKENTNEKTALTLLADCSEDIVVGVNGNIELQLGGHTSSGTLTVSGGTLVVTNGTAHGDSTIFGGSLEYRDCAVDKVVLNKGTLKIIRTTVTGDITVNNNGTCFVDKSTVTGKLVVHSQDAGVNADLSVFQGGCDLTAGHYSSNPDTFLKSVSYAVYDDANTSEYPYRIGAAVAHDGVHGYGSVQKALDSHKEEYAEFQVTLLKNTEETVIIRQNQIVLLNLNGHSLSSSKEPALLNYGNLTLTDTAGTGTVTGKDRAVEQRGDLTIAGHVKLTGNLENLYLFSGKTVTVAPGFDGEVGVTTEDKPGSGLPIVITGINSCDYSNYFQSDDDQYELVNVRNVINLRLPTRQKTVSDPKNTPVFIAETDTHPVSLIVEEIKELRRDFPKIQADALLNARERQTLSFISCRLSNGVATGKVNQAIVIGADMMKGIDTSSVSIWYITEDGTVTEVPFTINDKGEIVISDGLLGVYIIAN